MYAAGQKEMREMDHYTMEKIGLPGVVLMENAGARVMEAVLASSLVKEPRIMVLAGSGNNGGDGFVIARKLADAGINALLCLLVNPENLKGDAKLYYDVYQKRDLPLFLLHENTITGLQQHLDQADIIIDAMLGTGVSGTLREPYAEVISMVNKHRKEQLVIAVDIPSGLSSDTGETAGAAVKADKTISFVFPKKGFFLRKGPELIGEWKAVDISVPPSIAAELGLDLPKVITESMTDAAIPKRPEHGHKGTFGHVLVLGGSRSYVGAPIYTAKAALRSGAGLVTLAVPESIFPMAAVQCAEALMLPLPEEDGHFSVKAAAEVIPYLGKFKVVAVGPGLSRFQEGEELLRLLITSLTNQALVVDADALFLLRNNLELVRQYRGPVLLTPHPGEMAGLYNKTVPEIENNRLDTARIFAKEFQVYLLLKGHRSILAAPDGEVYINPYGHDALGKGGSGDVLTGMITSFLAQGASPKEALIAASYLHARAGEEKAKTLSHYGVMPLDIMDGVRELLNKA